MIQLGGQKALITGAAKRIGRECALALADEGVDIVVHYAGSRDEAEATASIVRERGVKAYTVQADFLDPLSFKPLIQQSLEMAGGLDILVNNASDFPMNEFWDFNRDDLAHSVEVTAWAPLELGREFAKVVKTGAIVNMIDARVCGYDWKHTAYHAAKILLDLFTREMAIKFAPDIRVNGVGPGLILPPEGKDESYLESLKGTTLLQKYGSALDIAAAVVFLLKSDFITGHTVFVDGGRHLKGPALG